MRKGLVGVVSFIAGVGLVCISETISKGQVFLFHGLAGGVQSLWLEISIFWDDGMHLDPWTLSLTGYALQDIFLALTGIAVLVTASVYVGRWLRELCKGEKAQVSAEVLGAAITAARD